MKIGLVLSKTPNYSETFFISKINGLQQSGHEPILFVQKKDKKFNLCKVVEAPKILNRNWVLQLYTILTWSFKLFGNAKRVINFVQLEKEINRPWKQIFKNLFNNAHILTNNVDWLHFGFATMAINSENVAQVIGAEMAVSLRGYDMAIYPIKHKNCYELLWTKVNKVHTISNDLLDLAYQNGLSINVPHMKITPAIDVLFFKNETIKEFSKPIKIATVARLHWKKGIVYTLEALNKVKSLDFEYTIIGDGPEFQAISFCINQLGLNEQVSLVGQKSANEVKAILSGTDIYIQYSISEGFCNAALEAQAMGCLCVVSDAEGLSENVLNDQTGWVVQKRKPNLLAKKLLTILELSQNEQQLIRESAIKRIQLKFTIEQQHNAFARFYEAN